MDDTIEHLIAPLFAAAFVGVVGWLSGFSIELIAFVSIVVAIAAFVPLWIAGLVDPDGRTRHP